MATNDAVIQSQGSSLRNLENLVGQFAKELKNRSPGTLPSNIDIPKRDGKEHYKAIPLRGGKTLETPKVKKKNQKDPVSSQEEQRKEQGQVQEESKEAENSAKKSGANAVAMPQQNFQQNRPPPPFPQRFQKQQ